MPQLLLFPHHPPADAEPPPLGGDDRAAVLDVLLRGGSPQAACRALRLDLRSFDRAADEDVEFRRRLRHARRQMTENVVSVVYQAAVKGTPAAQALWLRTFPPEAFDNPSEPELSAERPDAFQELTEDAAALQLRAYKLADGREPD